MACLLCALGCEEPREPRSEVGEAIDTVGEDESAPAFGETDCVDPTNPACTTEPRPGSMQDVEEATTD